MVAFFAFISLFSILYADMIHLAFVFLLAIIATVQLFLRSRPMAAKKLFIPGLVLTGITLLLVVLEAFGIIFFVGGKTFTDVYQYVMFPAVLFFTAGFAVCLFSAKKKWGARIFTVLLTMILVGCTLFFTAFSDGANRTMDYIIFSSPDSEHTLVVRRIDAIDFDSDVAYYQFYRQIAPGLLQRIESQEMGTNIYLRWAVEWEGYTVRIIRPLDGHLIYSYNFEE